ncbi:MAG: DUF1573 domain-containing protein [Bacteroidota bacterium]
MKLLITILSLFIFQSVATPPEAVEWLGPKTVDVGDIIYNEPTEHIFEFRNKTDAPLLIENVRTACGCTTTDWQDTPVPPGEIGQIRVVYDAAKRGFFRKYIKVFFYDVRGAQKLWLEGYVE